MFTCFWLVQPITICRFEIKLLNHGLNGINLMLYHESLSEFSLKDCLAAILLAELLKLDPQSYV